MPKKKNPVPKIGRSIKEGYQFKQFKPSKKFEKQFPKAAQRREAAIKKAMPPIAKGYAEQLEELGRKVRSGELVIQRIQPPESDFRDKIAVLSNEYGIEDTSEILDVDIDLLDRYIAGGRITPMERDNIEGGFLDMRRDTEIKDLYNINVPKLDQDSAIVHRELGYIGSDINRDTIRLAIAEQEIDIDNFGQKGLLFRNLTDGSQLGRILDGYREQQIAILEGKAIPEDKLIDLDEMFEMFIADGMDIWDVEESQFWAWFREIFYS